MMDDLLLSDRNPEIKKVKYIDDDEETGGIGGIITTEPNGGNTLMTLIVGSSLFCLLALTLLFTALKRRGKEEVKEEGVLGITPYDGKNLGVTGICPDVHECTSSSCPKCYVDNKIMFLEAPETPRPPSTKAADDRTKGWGMAPSLDSSSFETSSTTEFTEGKPSLFNCFS